MPFFTSQQLFGNGAGNPGDPGWVPIDTAAPPTFSANNRGTAFGEQVTAAIANRAAYALALNGDDLNQRLAVFETGGLDSAYRAGLLSDPSIGRFITIDGGALETTSALASAYADDIANAHVRVDTLANVVRGGGGFDFVGAGATGINDATYGFLDRRVFELNAAGSVFSFSEACTLNPGGAGGDQVSLDAATVHTAGATGLILGADMVEITGTPSSDGLYFVTGLVAPADQRCTVIALDGTIPAFPSNTPGTARFFRPIFGSYAWLGHASSTTHEGVTIVGHANQNAALTVISGTPGSTLAAQVLTADMNGVLQSVFYVDPAGNVDAAGDYTSPGNIVIQGGLSADLDVSALGNVSAGADVIGNSFNYASPITRFVNIDLALLQPETASQWTYWNASYWVTLAADAYIFVPLTPFLPAGATLVAVEIVFEGNAAGAAFMAVERRTSNFAPFPLVPTVSSVGGPVANQNATASRQLIRATPPVGAVNNETERLYAYIYSGMVVGSRVHAVRAEFQDPGPRNH
jgi:hypothetical protein